MKHIEVAAAVIIRDNTVFAAQRGDGGELARKWEFPGGKLERGECGEEAIVREILEELGTEVRVLRPLVSVEHQYRTFSLTLHGYLCELVGGQPTLSEHLASKWLGKSELASVPWAEADLPIVKAVSALLE
ncbi:MAG: (deoxy)nucleoside triphosphate pyrophosphohydrolase [Spirochaetia bacterium]|nr:(deoxy)nucleoside triphosphate pyrophosphohydrolase [Spirochaetia bacterium]